MILLNKQMNLKALDCRLKATSAFYSELQYLVNYISKNTKTKVSNDEVLPQFSFMI